MRLIVSLLGLAVYGLLIGAPFLFIMDKLI